MQLKPTCLIGACPLSFPSGGGGQGLSKTNHSPQAYKHARTACTWLHWFLHTQARTPHFMHATCMHKHVRTLTMHACDYTMCNSFFFQYTAWLFFAILCMCGGETPAIFFCKFFRMPGERNFNRCAAYFSFVVEIFKFVWYHLGLLMAWLVSWISRFFCLYCVHKQLPFIFRTIKNMQRIVNSVFWIML